MTLPLKIIFTKNAAKSLQTLDATTRQRVWDKLDAIAADPLNPINSYPLQGTNKRSARVGGYRIIVLIQDPNLLVVDIDSRGQVYRNI
jgi:mRNA-degrading endonuclease RelE of RelBE toxin-antitoxin system